MGHVYSKGASFRVPSVQVWTNKERKKGGKTEIHYKREEEKRKQGRANFGFGDICTIRERN